jgi:hypothetical protein
MIVVTALVDDVNVTVGEWTVVTVTKVGVIVVVVSV